MGLRGERAVAKKLIAYRIHAHAGWRGSCETPEAEDGLLTAEDVSVLPVRVRDAGLAALLG